MDLLDNQETVDHIVSYLLSFAWAPSLQEAFLWIPWARQGKALGCIAGH